MSGANNQRKTCVDECQRFRKWLCRSGILHFIT
jgi:hypothetical protein